MDLSVEIAEKVLDVLSSGKSIGRNYLAEQIRGVIDKRQSDLMAENERLREALGAIVWNVDAGTVPLSWCSDFARNAMERKGK